jgi:hypothetical protein
LVPENDQELRKLLMWMKSKVLAVTSDMVEMEQAWATTYTYRKTFIHNKNKPTVTEIMDEFPKLMDNFFLVILTLI